MPINTKKEQIILALLATTAMASATNYRRDSNAKKPQRDLSKMKPSGYA